MDGAWLARARWRRRGAWMWPAFVALTAADALIGNRLPPDGESWNAVGAALAGCFLNLIGIAVLSAPFGALVRRRRPDLPKIVARDYSGTIVMLTVSAVLLAFGLAHRPAILRDRRTMDDAISRAQAFIGDRAPAEFRRNLSTVDTFTIQTGRVYRMCVPSTNRPREYCVIVKPSLPLAASVSFGGYEPNAVFGAGAN
jgi:hypothetical protein